MINRPKPTSAVVTNRPKVSIGETWSSITTTWAGETRTWLAVSQLIINRVKPSASAITNTPKP